MSKQLASFLIAVCCIAVRPETSKHRVDTKTKDIPDWVVLLRLQETNNAVAVYVGKSHQEMHLYLPPLTDEIASSIQV